MKTRKTKEKLSELIVALYGEGCECCPEDLIVNRGGNKYNDWCSWTGKCYVFGKLKQFCSWDRMGELVKYGNLCFVGNSDKSTIREITYQNSKK